MNMDRFSDMNALLADAHRQALSFGHPYVGTEHMLLALVGSAGGRALMMKLGVEPSDVGRLIRNVVQEGPSRPTSSDVCYTPRSTKVFEFAVKEADHFGCHQVRREHLLIGMIQEADGIAGTVLRELGVDAQRVRHAAASDLETAEARKSGAPAARRPTWKATGSTCLNCGKALTQHEDQMFCPTQNVAKTTEQEPDPPCEHVEKFRTELRAFIARSNAQHNYVSLDGTLDAHCHICSAVFKIPEDLMRPSSKDKVGRKPQAVVTRLKVVTSVNVPDFSNGQRVTTGHVAVPLDPSVSLWLVSVQDEVGEWKETYATEIEKDAFLRGFRAASSMHGEPDPVVVEIQKP